MITNRELRFAYATFNKKYFSNKLPKDMPVFFSSQLIRKKKLGRTAVHAHTFRPQWIEITTNIRFSGHLIRMTLLHEMCHVENPRPTGHGKWHDDRMMKLAKAGAFNGYW